MRSIWISEVKYAKYLFLTFYVEILNTNAKARNTHNTYTGNILYIFSIPNIEFPETVLRQMQFYNL